MAGGDHQWFAWRGSFTAARSNVARLDRPRAFMRDDFIFRGKYQALLAARSPPRICRRTDILLELLFLDDNRDSTRLVRPAILSGHLFRSLGLVLRIDAAAASQNCPAR